MNRMLDDDIFSGGLPSGDGRGGVRCVGFFGRGFSGSIIGNTGCGESHSVMEVKRRIDGDGKVDVAIFPYRRNDE